MECAYNVIIDKTEYEEHDKLREGLVEYKSKKDTNYTNRNNHNCFFAKRAMYSEDLHLSEYLSGIVGKKLGFKVCDTDLYRNSINYNDRGVISYVHLSDCDVIVSPRSIIQAYLKYKQISYDDLFCFDIDTIFKSIFWIMYKYNRPYDEFISFKQDFIDMIVFDLKFLNSDRNLDNWLIRQDKRTKSIDLYPMFDNEMFLSFNFEANEYLSDDEIKKKNQENTSAILTPRAMINHEHSVDFIEMFELLLEKYPVQLQNSLNKFQNFSDADLLKILNKIPELTNIRKDTVVRLYNERSLELNKIYQKHLEYQAIFQK